MICMSLCIIFGFNLRDRGEELSERVREEKQNTLDEGDKEKVTAKCKRYQ